MNNFTNLILAAVNQCNQQKLLSTPLNQYKTNIFQKHGNTFYTIMLYQAWQITCNNVREAFNMLDLVLLTPYTPYGLHFTFWKN